MLEGLEKCSGPGSTSLASEHCLCKVLILLPAFLSEPLAQSSLSLSLKKNTQTNHVGYFSKLLPPRQHMFMEGKLENTDEQKEENRRYFHSTAQENSSQHVRVFPSKWFLV